MPLGNYRQRVTALARSENPEVEKVASGAPACELQNTFANTVLI